MHFVFENINTDAHSNFINCSDLNSSGIRRFTPSPLANALTRAASDYFNFSLFGKVTFTDTVVPGKKYIIASGIAHSPMDWCGPDTETNGFDERLPNKKTLFSYLSNQYLEDLQAGNAWLLLDQSHEGYQVPWLWDWFHNNCKTYNIDPKQIIYVTGNLNSKVDYEDWLKERRLTSGMLIIPNPHFETMMYETLKHGKLKLPSFNDHLQYKTKNLENIKVYNALQKRPRAHRAWFFKYLVDSNLLSSGINSMNMFKFTHTYYENQNMSEEDYKNIASLLPIMPPGDNNVAKFSDGDCGNYLTAFNEEIMLTSWVSVISEASFGDSEGTCFISEKTFKPIACHHPFIIFGNKGSLEQLRNLGYKTFSPFIDETYDSLPTWDRMAAIVKEIERIKNIPISEKISWYSGMKDILIHNYKVLKYNSQHHISSHLNKINNHCKG